MDEKREPIEDEAERQDLGVDDLDVEPQEAEQVVGGTKRHSIQPCI
jgi:hypothetical protein